MYFLNFVNGQYHSNKKFICFLIVQAILFGSCKPNLDNESEVNFMKFGSFNSCRDSGVSWKPDNIKNLPGINREILRHGWDLLLKMPYKKCGEWVNEVTRRANAKYFWELGPWNDPDKYQYVYGTLVGTVTDNINPATGGKLPPGVKPGDFISWGSGGKVCYNGKRRPGATSSAGAKRVCQTLLNHVAIIASVSTDNNALCIWENGNEDGRGARREVYDFWMHSIYSSANIKIYRPIKKGAYRQLYGKPLRCEPKTGDNEGLECVGL